MKKFVLQYSNLFCVAFSACIFNLFSFKANAQNIDYTTTTCPRCSLPQIAFHTEVKDKYLGVFGHNPSRPSTYSLIGTNKFAGVDPFRTIYDAFYGGNWYPIRTDKQNLVGTFYRFNVNHLGDENDWNIHIVPDNEFEILIADALDRPNKDLNKWQENSEGRYSIEAEVTPITNAFNNAWFNNVTGRTTLLNKKIGVYGPFVAESYHGYKPEIHPSEQIWWKDDTGNLTTILLIADASNRFDEMSDYSTAIAIPDPQPWTEDNGQEAELRIPFEINPANGSVAYNLYSLYDNNSFHSGANFSDASSGLSHTITYEGSEVLTINGPSTLGKYVGVTFEDVCFDTSKSMLKGYIILNTAIGNGGGGREGFVALQLEKKEYGINHKPGILVGDIINTSNTWTAYNTLYDNTISISDNNVISSDKYGKGIVDGMIDFNGNGITDLFAVNGNKWMVLYDGLGQWQEINTARVPLNELRFGDINGDGITDILYVNPQKKVLVSMGGVQRWQEITDAGDQTNDIRVGDFNADNETDIVYMKFMGMVGFSTYGRFNMYVKYSGVGSWQELNSGYNLYVKNSNDNATIFETYNNVFRFGNFNGDNITDIFRYDKNKFKVYWNGRGDAKDLCSPQATNYDMNDFLFVNNLSKVDYTDVIYVQRRTGVWKIFYEGKRITGGRPLKYSNPFTVNFGNLDGDDLWKPFVVDAVRQTRIPVDNSFVAPTIKMEPFVMPKYARGSIKRSSINGKPILTVDMNLQYHGGTAGVNRGRSNFRSVTQVKEKSNANLLQYTPSIAVAGEVQPIGKIEKIPLGSKENEIEVKFSSNSTPIEFEIRPYGIGAVPHSITETIDGEGNWNTWKSYLSPEIKPHFAPLLNSSPGVVERVKTLQFELLPYYSTMEDGRVSLVEMGDMMKELNEIIYGENPAKITEIFGNTSVFTIKWKFELINISNGMTMPVDGPQSISSNGKWLNNKITFTFPEQNELLQFKATATIEDDLGNISPEATEIIFYNQRVKFSEARNQLSSWLEKVRSVNGKAHENFTRNANYLAIDNLLSPEEIMILLK